MAQQFRKLTVASPAILSEAHEMRAVALVGVVKAQEAEVRAAAIVGSTAVLAVACSHREKNLMNKWPIYSSCI